MGASTPHRLLSFVVPCFFWSYSVMPRKEFVLETVRDCGLFLTSIGLTKNLSADNVNSFHVTLYVTSKANSHIVLLTARTMTK
ncbi:hypothetical protein F4823DRAFT_404111 [Ustulina deusta]|nr:hypothetical protein F4823DRAFT_404111 [Ustulina deusta]